MIRKQFTFYESFSKALSRIKEKEDRADAYDAISNYALYGIEPDLESMSDVAAVAFELIKPTLDSSKKKASNGRLGGSKRKQNGSKKKANCKRGQTPSEGEGEIEKEVEVEVEVEKENECYPPTPLPDAAKAKAPSFDMVKNYAEMRRTGVDPKPFFDYYDSAGWQDSEGKPVLNWQQKFIAWEMRELEKAKKNEPKEYRYDYGDTRGSL